MDTHKNHTGLLTFRIYRWIGLAAALILMIIALPLTQRVGMAQDQASLWSQPVNLSRSGSASMVHPLIDASQSLNLVWQDEFSGLMHTQRVGESWLQPAPLDLPFADGLANLSLQPDATGLVHAAWIDSEGNLFYSRVEGRLFSTPSAWSSPQQLGTSAVELDLDVDPAGRLHLAYIRVTETSQAVAGVYYRLKENASLAWTTSTLIYASLYYRGLSPEDVQVSVAGSQEGPVFLAWDERPQDRLFMATSVDAGRTWGVPEEIDRRRPDDSQTAAGPAWPEVASLEQQVLLTWQAGHGGTDCSMAYRWSADSGQTWSEPGLLPAPFLDSCATESQMLADSATGSIRMMLTTAEAGYLTAWKAEAGQDQWSTPTEETELVSFTNPESYRLVTVGARLAVLEGNSLLVAASEAGEAGDVWLLRRTLQQVEDQAPAPEDTLEWSDPAILESGTATFSAPALLVDSLDRLHAFWSQSGSDKLYYALWDGARWTPAIPILVSPGGAPASLSAAVHPSGILFLTWSDPLSGELFFSSAPLNQANNPSSWSTPQMLPTNGLSSSAPQAVVTADGWLAIAYSVPINEGRGLYVLTTSSALEPGQPLEWQPPSQAFDAAAAGWDMVGEARLAAGPQGTLHLFWQRLALSSQAPGRGLFYTQTRQPASAGMEWQPAAEVTGSQTSWHALLAAPDGTVHRLWQEDPESGPVWHQYSPGGGSEWSAAARLTGGQNGGGRLAASFDAGYQLNLFQLFQTFESAWTIQRWSWQGGQSWSTGSSQPVDDIQSASSLAVAGLKDSSLAVLINGQLKPVDPSASAGTGENGLLYTRNHPPESPPTQTAQSTFVPAATGSPAGSGPALTPQPSPTLEFSSAPPDSAASDLDPRLRGLLLGAVPAVLLFVVFVALILQRERRQ